jgi:hypothetical protein
MLVIGLNLVLKETFRDFAANLAFGKDILKTKEHFHSTSVRRIQY